MERTRYTEYAHTEMRWYHLATLCIWTWPMDGRSSHDEQRTPFMQIEHKTHNINLVWIFLSFGCVSVLNGIHFVRPGTRVSVCKGMPYHTGLWTLTRWRLQRQQQKCRTQKVFSGVAMWRSTSNDYLDDLAYVLSVKRLPASLSPLVFSFLSEKMCENILLW